MGVSYRSTGGFGRRMEYWIIGRMLKEGLDVYVPLVDDFGIDAVIRKNDDTFVEVQIKARSATVTAGDAALFAAIVHAKPRPNYYFIFYSERMDMMWIMTSEQFIARSNQNKMGKNAGKRSIWFNGRKKEHKTGISIEHAYAKFDEFRMKDFSVFKSAAKLAIAPEKSSES